MSDKRMKHGQRPKSGLQPDGSWILDDSELFEKQLSGICVFCKHWDAYDGRVCPAYPERIPDAIWDERVTHVFPYGGEQRGADGQPILFESAPDLAHGVLPDRIAADLAQRNKHGLTRTNR